MSEYVSDTHALYWHLTGNPRLSPTAQQLFVGADRGLHRIFVSAITLVEMVYLVERDRLDAQTVAEVFRLLSSNDGSYVVASLDVPVARTLQTVSRAAIPDVPDRIITATAISLGLPLITRDEKITRSGAVTVTW